MFGVFYLVVALIVLGISGAKKSFRDLSFKTSDTTAFPFWVDSNGTYRWKHNNKKIYAVTWDSEKHLIITDKNFNDIDWTWKEIQAKLDRYPDLILQYGQNIHNKDMIPGIRYVTKVNGEYRYYVSVRYGKMHYFMDIKTEKIVTPVYACIQYEKDAKEQGYEYCTEEEIKQGIEELNKMSTLERRKYCDYQGIPDLSFNNLKSYRQKLRKGDN